MLCLFLPFLDDLSTLYICLNSIIIMVLLPLNLLYSQFLLYFKFYSWGLIIDVATFISGVPLITGVWIKSFIARTGISILFQNFVVCLISIPYFFLFRVLSEKENLPRLKTYRINRDKILTNKLWCLQIILYSKPPF